MDKDTNNTEETVESNSNDNKVDVIKKAKDIVADIGNDVVDTAKKVKEVFDEKTPEIIETVGEMADKVGELADEAKYGADKAIQNAKLWIKTKKDADKSRKRDFDKNALMPIFSDQIPEDYSEFPVVNVVDSDEKRSKSEACFGSVGFRTEAKDVNVLNIYTSQINLFPISLGTNPKEGIYYENPYIQNDYIESSQYAMYLKEERVRELVNIAYSLGAKKVSVRFVTEEKKAEEQAVKAGLKAGKAKAQLDAVRKLKDSLKLSIVKTETYEGHDHPTRPNLVYYKDDKTINEMIEKRINGTNPILKQSYSVAYATSSSAKKKEAVKIDGALKSLKLGASESLSVCSELEQEITLDYEIEF